MTNALLTYEVLRPSFQVLTGQNKRLILYGRKKIKSNLSYNGAKVLDTISKDW